MLLSLEKLSKYLSSKSPRKALFTLSQRNIYIFPSTLGAGFLLLLVLMLLTAINYQNSLIYLLTFFLGTLFFLSIWMCFLNMSGLVVESKAIYRCFEGEGAGYSINFSRKPRLPLALKVGMQKANAQDISFSSHDTVEAVINAKAMQRGCHSLDRLYIESRFPFGLILSWTWLKLDAECWVYPLAIDAIPDAAFQSDEDQENKVPISNAALLDLKSYQAGDPTNRILWKRYAAKDEVIIRYSEGGSINPSWVDWDRYSGLTEERLRYLCHDICKLSEVGASFGLKIPGVVIEPATGPLHRQKCLDALALF